LSDAIPEIPVIHEAQVTAAHVYTLVSDQVIPRLDKIENTIKESGLNGHTPLLKDFLEGYASTYMKKQAWETVVADLKHRVRFLQPGKHWLTVLFSAILGGIGWQVAGGHFSFPHLPHF
jgi:phosphohistidine phosphatase SixA